MDYGFITLGQLYAEKIFMSQRDKLIADILNVMYENKMPIDLDKLDYFKDDLKRAINRRFSFEKLGQSYYDTFGELPQDQI